MQAGTAQTGERRRAEGHREDELHDLGWGDRPGPHTPPTEGAGPAAAPSSCPPAAPRREPRTPACVSDACRSHGTMVCGRVPWSARTILQSRSYRVGPIIVRSRQHPW